MRTFFTRIAIGLIIVIAIFSVGYFALNFFKDDKVVKDTIPPAETTIWQSVEKRSIETYTFGDGGKHLLFVGGIHGGYEWNSVLLAYQLIDYLEINKELIPENIKVTIIPSANPDGIFEVTNKDGRFHLSDLSLGDKSSARFNANGVDLNRNFDCKWQPESMWRGDIVSAGTSAFSEPETQAIRDFVLKNKPVAVVFFHSQSNAVYASECEDGILSETLNIMNAYSDASGYPAIDTFDAYEITGDAEGWLASIGIPAITVELSTHEIIEWNKNLAGVKALFEYYK